jgi:nitrite reductase (NO-forming)
MRVKILFATWAFLGISSLLHAADSNAQMDHGRDLYFRNCLICHQLNGQGVPGTYPPLAKSDYLMADRERSMRILCEG